MFWVGRRLRVAGRALAAAHRGASVCHRPAAVGEAETQARVGAFKQGLAASGWTDTAGMLLIDYPLGYWQC